MSRSAGVNLVRSHGRDRFGYARALLEPAVFILGFVLIPGVDDQGDPWRMDFFHAFYFVSFMGTTIGFGEIPYAFTEAQRLWATISIYATVISWLYGRPCSREAALMRWIQRRRIWRLRARRSRYAVASARITASLARL